MDPQGLLAKQASPCGEFWARERPWLNKNEVEDTKNVVPVLVRQLPHTCTCIPHTNVYRYAHKYTLELFQHGQTSRSDPAVIGDAKSSVRLTGVFLQHVKCS